MKSQRIAFLDGLRGVAIVGVLIFHGFVCYPENLPFGDKFGFAPLRFGWVGVQLFFLISGFVIFMTLEQCQSLRQFAAKRWLRLFPAMLVASLIILALQQVARKRRSGTALAARHDTWTAIYQPLNDPRRHRDSSQIHGWSFLEFFMSRSVFTLFSEYHISSLAQRRLFGSS